MSGAPMTDAQRAALEQRLAQLRAAQAAATASTTAPGTHPATNGGHPASIAAQPADNSQRGGADARGAQAPQMGYAYEDDAEDDEEDDEDDNDVALRQFEEEVRQIVARQDNARLRGATLWQSPPTSSHESGTATVTRVSDTRHADEGVHVVATDKTAPRSRELGDFEVLRLAKMGDGASMKDFGNSCGVVWRTFADNRGRNTLHYAADAGSAELIRLVADDLHVPYVADEKQMTPLDIALLNGHAGGESDEVHAALVAAAKASGHADGGASGAAKTLESVLRAHAPAPPKFVMSKPVPKAVEAAGRRSFWSSIESPAATAAGVVCSSGADLSASEQHAAMDAVNSLDQHGRLEWLRPVTRGAAAPCEAWQVALASNGAPAGPTGVAVAQVLDGSPLKGAAAAKVAGARVVVAAHLAVRADAQRTGVASALLHALRARLQEVVAGSGAVVVFFASGTQLRRPPTALATVKWYRRVFEAANVHASDSAYDVFTDFYTYDEVLRADAVLKGAIPASLQQRYVAELPSWCTLEVSSEEQCALVLHFMESKAGSAESSVDVACVPADVQELRRVYLGHPDHRAYVRTTAQAAVTDFVVLRVRDARRESAVSAGAFAAEVVYALFTTIAGTAKVDHMMLLASKLLNAQMLLVPTMFGITESDLAKSNFDEIVPHREYVYAVSLSTRSDVEGLTPMAAAKLSLPLYTL
ncbi:Ankyrin repeats (many copies) [Novymonas esmeraldas]|uniref:Ankyrin repeats (Many copies) n=1 Tax=Novymonas esmeraldas TaxID=1808958 RepID=A0AAW0F2F8_9TRYP